MLKRERWHEAWLAAGAQDPAFTFTLLLHFTPGVLVNTHTPITHLFIAYPVRVLLLALYLPSVNITSDCLPLQHRHHNDEHNVHARFPPRLLASSVSLLVSSCKLSQTPGSLGYNHEQYAHCHISSRGSTLSLPNLIRPSRWSSKFALCTTPHSPKAGLSTVRPSPRPLPRIHPATTHKAVL